jgi:hypothetical protein
VEHVLDDWSRRLAEEFEAVALFDLPSGDALYRVFLLSGCLQLDVSFAPASRFGAIGPNFRLLFGRAVEKPWPPAPDARQLFGYGVHHIVRASVCIKRNRCWQAEYWTSSVRDYAMTMACVRSGLPAHFGRGFDGLPDDIRQAAAATLVQGIGRDELRTALTRAANLLLSEADLASVCAPRLREQLIDFISTD